MKPDSAAITWRSPSNIALVKYWGKREGQIPANPSISFSLDQAFTETSVLAVRHQDANGVQMTFSFHGANNPAFEDKIRTYLNLAVTEFKWLNEYRLEISSTNTFPHSSGIASSASAYSALALCLCSLHEQIIGQPLMDFYQKASSWARLGSGSACRSVYGGFNEWGFSSLLADSSDLHAINIDYRIHSVFKSFKDTILIIEKGKKAVSSTMGHALLKAHPFAETRYGLARENTGKLLSILEQGDLDGFVDLVEAEALMLHALMMTSSSPFILMKPNTLAVIEKVRDFRNQTGLHVLFTLDAGANVHILNTEEENAQIQDFVKNQLIGFCQNESYFCNAIGKGPLRL